MTLTVKEDAFERIKHTEKSRPLAVFTVDARGESRPHHLDVIFADTAHGAWRAKHGVGYLGIYHSGNYGELSLKLREMRP